MSNNSSSTSGTCFPIANSPILPEFNDIMISEASSFRNQTGLEMYFKQLGTVAKNGKIVFQCSKNDDFGQVRYLSSVFISSIIADQSKSCYNSKQLPLLCKNTAEIAKKTFDDFLIKNQCGQYSTKLDNYLAIVSSKDNQDGCFSGLFIEQQQCGFIGKNDATNYCTNVNPQDNCCSSVSTSNSTMNKSLVIGLSIGIFVLILIFCAFIWGYRCKRQQNTSNNSTFDQDTMKAIQNYDPVLIDEIKLKIGDIVIVKAKFDDGWGFGINITTENEGSFPLNCLGSIDGTDGDKSKSKGGEQFHSIRGSSLTKDDQKTKGLNRSSVLSAKFIPSHSKSFCGTLNLPSKAFKSQSIYSTVKISQPLPAKHRNIEDLYKSVRISKTDRAVDKFSGHSTLKELPSPGKSDIKSVSSFAMSPISPVESLSPSIYAEYPPSPITFETVRIAPASQFSSKPTRNTRKFKNDDLKYGTASTASSSSSARPKVTATFNNMK